MYKTTLFISVIIFAALGCTKNEKKAADYSKIENSILIVYSSGTPYKTISDIKPDEIDAHSGATPADMNVDIISKMLAAELQHKNYNIKLVKASDITNYREILQYRMLIIGTPVYFWNMHSDIKKMMDECFEKIYIARRDDFKAMRHGVFAMAEYGGSADNAIKQIEFGITDCSAKLDISKAFIAKQTRPDYELQVKAFAQAVDSLMQLK